jgi:hypothetical protein
MPRRALLLLAVPLLAVVVASTVLWPDQGTDDDARAASPDRVKEFDGSVIEVDAVAPEVPEAPDAPAEPAGSVEDRSPDPAARPAPPAPGPLAVAPPSTPSSPASPPATPPPTPPTPPTTTPPGPPDPEPPAEVERATSAAIGPSGGSVEAVAIDGTTSELVVPPGALAATTTITLTPTKAFGASPAIGTALAGVDLEPAGLQFEVPAALRIDRPGGLPDGPLLAVRWEDDPTEATAARWQTAGDGSAVVEVPHFSGAGVGTPTVVGCATITPGDAGPAEFAQVIDTLVATQGAPDEDSPLEAEIVGLLEAWYGLHVADPLDAADSRPELIAAARRLVDWHTVAQCLGVDDESTFATDLAAGRGLLGQRGDALARRHLVPQCNALESALLDWVKAPNELSAMLTLLTVAEAGPLAEELNALPVAGAPVHLPYCLRAVIHELEAPEHIAPADRFVEVSFQLRSEVVAQGGDLGATPQRIDLAEFLVRVDVAGGTIDGAPAGATEQLLTTDAVGRATVTIDRGADEAARTPVVEVLIDAVRNGPGAVPASLQVEDDTTLRPFQATRLLELRPEPALQVALAVDTGGAAVPAGGQAAACATVRDEAGDLVPGATVTFELVGPGSLSVASAITGADGRACTSYTAPELAEAQDVEVRARAAQGAVTSEVATADILVAAAQEEHPAGTVVVSYDERRSTSFSSPARQDSFEERFQASFTVPDLLTARLTAVVPVTATGRRISDIRQIRRFIGGDECVIRDVTTTEFRFDTAVLRVDTERGIAQLSLRGTRQTTEARTYEGPDDFRCLRDPTFVPRTTVGPLVAVNQNAVQPATAVFDEETGDLRGFEYRDADVTFTVSITP